MTDRYLGAILHCTAPVEAAHVSAAQMLRRVAHVEEIGLPKGPGMLVVLDDTMRDDDFRGSLGLAFEAFGFVTSVEPIVWTPFGSHAADFVTKLMETATALKPETPEMVARSDLGDHVAQLHQWTKVRDALHDIALKLMHPERKK